MENNETDIISSEIKNTKQKCVDALSVRYAIGWVRILQKHKPKYPSPTPVLELYNANVKEHAKQMKRLMKVKQYLLDRQKREIKRIYES